MKINDLLYIRDFLRKYDNEEGIKKLKNGDVPSFLKKQFQQYKNKEKNRRKQNLSEINNYDYAYFYAGDI